MLSSVNLVHIANSPSFKLHFNRDGFAPSSYERITDAQEQEHSDLGYNVDWQTAEKERPEQQPTRQPRKTPNDSNKPNRPNAQQNKASQTQNDTVNHSNDRRNHKNTNDVVSAPQDSKTQSNSVPVAPQTQNIETTAQPQAVAWLSNLFAQAPQATTTPSVSSHDAAEAIEALVNTGAQSLGSFGQVDGSALNSAGTSSAQPAQHSNSQKDDSQSSDSNSNRQQARRNNDSDTDENNNEDRRRRKTRKSRSSKPRQRKESTDETTNNVSSTDNSADNKSSDTQDQNQQEKRQQDNRRNNNRNRNNRQDSDRSANEHNKADRNENASSQKPDEQTRTKRKSHSQRGSRGKLERGETLTADNIEQSKQQNAKNKDVANSKNHSGTRRSQDPNEVVLQVNEAPTTLKASEVVHLSLDDSKSTQAKPQSNDKQSQQDSAAKNESTKERATKQPTNKPSSSEQNAEKQNTTAQKADKRSDDKQSTVETSERQVNNDEGDATKANVQNDTPVQEPVAKERKAPVEAAVSSISNTESKSEAPTPVTADAKETQETPKQQQTADTTDSGRKTEASKQAPAHESRSALELTHEALFGTRYVTAEKFGQASNDPRVVQSKQAQAASTPQVEQSAAVSAPTIRGTVGEFIRTMLPDAQTRLAEDGVINSFIATIALFAEQTKATDNTAEDKISVGDSDVASQSFDFSNYGYQPLAAEYLTRFEAMTQAVGQFAAAQGKTEVEPRTISKRASNDPRGQHPDYQESTQDSAVLSVPDKLTSENEEPLVDSKQDTAEVDAHNVEATALANQTQTENVSADSEHLLEVEHAQSATKNVEAEARQATDDKAAESTKEASKDDSQAAKSKTTIASYKNMIENVAEQLLPQTGMFNLTTPKVPKARSRKPKSEHKKPTQVEKAEADDTSDES